MPPSARRANMRPGRPQRAQTRMRALASQATQRRPSGPTTRLGRARWQSTHAGSVTLVYPAACSAWASRISAAGMLPFGSASASGCSRSHESSSCSGLRRVTLAAARSADATAWPMPSTLATTWAMSRCMACSRRRVCSALTALRAGGCCFAVPAVPAWPGRRPCGPGCRPA